MTNRFWMYFTAQNPADTRYASCFCVICSSDGQVRFF